MSQPRMNGRPPSPTPASAPRSSTGSPFNATIIETGTESYRLARARAGASKPAA